MLTYWHIGKRIVEEEQGGEQRAEYGSQLISRLAKELTASYGRNYSKRIRRLLSVSNPKARQWYAINAAQEMWSFRTLPQKTYHPYCLYHPNTPDTLESDESP
ncbi:MAG: hypothetical protein K1W14_05885 [Muribaculaceae bacterium]